MLYRRDMHYVVTGGAGFIGSNITKKLFVDINTEVYLGLWDDIGTPERLNAARKTTLNITTQ